ncbi:MAG: signal peptidase I [Herpetosiphonaceae bacterium]|nr:signal peptidase I [Herpetosiphonaceae bacterium]
MTSTPLRDHLEHPQAPAETDFLKPVHLEPAPPPSDDFAIPEEEDILAEAAAPQRKGRAVVKEIVETVVFVLLVFFIVHGLVQNFNIVGASMAPTMHDDQYILVNKAVYTHFDLNAPLRLLPGRGALPSKVVYPFQSPQRGDVVVFLAPDSADDEPDKDYIKRVIAVAGETVAVRNGKVYVNDVLLDETSYLSETVPTTCDGFQSVCNTTVPPGHIFVMGDNRPNSSDSRRWGPLPLENVVGKAWASYWPKADWGMIKAPVYARQ